MIDKANEEAENKGEEVDNKLGDMMSADVEAKLIKDRALFVNNNCMNKREMRRNKMCQEIKKSIEQGE